MRLQSLNVWILGVWDSKRLWLSFQMALIFPPKSSPSVITRENLDGCFTLEESNPIKGIDNLMGRGQKYRVQFLNGNSALPGKTGLDTNVGFQSLVENQGAERVSFLGPFYGAEKDNLYHSADLYVLPTHTENFGMTVAEALAHGLPAIVTKGAPWPGLETHDCGWWIDIGVEPLVECLKKAMSSSSEYLSEMGLRGRAWMRGIFHGMELGR